MINATTLELICSLCGKSKWGWDFAPPRGRKLTCKDCINKSRRSSRLKERLSDYPLADRVEEHEYLVKIFLLCWRLLAYRDRCAGIADERGEWQWRYLSEQERLLPWKEKIRLRYARDEEYRDMALTRCREGNKKDPSVRRARAHRRRALLRKQHDGTVSAKTIRGLVEKMKRCLYCGIKLSQGEAVIDHMVPVSKGGLHSKNNIAVTCYNCNALKLDKSFDEWVQMLSEPFKAKAIRYYEKTAGRKVEQGYLCLKFHR